MNPLAPWEVPLTDAEHSVILFFLVIAGLALFAQGIRSAFYGNAVSEAYRPAAVTGTAVTGVAFLTYIILLVCFLTGYVDHGAQWVPSSGAEWSYAARYGDWAVSVPLLLIQLFTVATFNLRRRNLIQGLAIVSAVLMVFTGYLGGVVINGGHSITALWVWGLISTFFFTVVYLVVVYTAFYSMPSLSEQARTTFRNAMTLLLITWFIYPFVFGLQGFTAGGAWTMVAQVALCCADIAAKVGFGSLLFRVARQRTEDDRADSTIKAGNL